MNKKELINSVLDGIDKLSETVINHKAAVLERENLVALAYVYSVLTNNNDSSEKHIESFKNKENLEYRYIKGDK